MSKRYFLNLLKSESEKGFLLGFKCVSFTNDFEFDEDFVDVAKNLAVDHKRIESLEAMPR